MSAENDKEKSNQFGIIAYKRALRILIIGVIVSVVLLLFAISSNFIEGGDSAGPSFFILGFLALAVLIISCLVSVFISAGGIIQSITTKSQNETSNEEEYRESIVKNLTLVLGIIFLILIAYKIFM